MKGRQSAAEFHMGYRRNEIHISSTSSCFVPDYSALEMCAVFNPSIIMSNPV
jgi:hypothetical protein